MSISQNLITRSIAPNSIFESAINQIKNTTTFNQGDLLVFDATNHVLKVPAAESEASTFLGISRCAIVNGKLPSPYNTSVVGSQGVSDIPGPQFGVVAKSILKTGSTLNPGDSVYLDPVSGAQNIAASGTKPVGVYVGQAIAGSPAGLYVEWRVGCRFNNDTLKF